MISLVVKPDDDGTERYGQKVSALQSNIQIKGTAISGTLNKVSSYTGFDSHETEGHYLALKFETDADKLTSKIIGGSGNVVDLTKDKYCVYKITGTSQKIELQATKSKQTTTKTYTLEGLQLSE